MMGTKGGVASIGVLLVVLDTVLKKAKHLLSSTTVLRESRTAGAVFDGQALVNGGGASS